MNYKGADQTVHMSRLVVDNGKDSVACIEAHMLNKHVSLCKLSYQMKFI